MLAKNSGKKKVITDIELNTILNWLKKNNSRHYYNENPNCEGYYIFTDSLGILDKDIKDIVDAVRNRIIKNEGLNLEDTLEQPLELSDIIVIMPTGTKLHVHKDPNKVGTIQVRYNLLLQKPEKGGDAIYSGRRIDCDTGCYILCRAGLDYHTGTLIEGKLDRLLISYGFLIKEENIEKYPHIFMDIIKNKDSILNSNKKLYTTDPSITHKKEDHIERK